MLRRCLVGALLCATAVVAAPSPAGAQTVDALCTGTIDQSWDPGLRLTNRTVHYTATLDYECESSDPAIDGATIRVDIASAVANCLVDPGSVTDTVTWNTGETSVIQMDVLGVTVGGGAQVFEGNGTVTSGKFAGDTVQMLNVFASLDLLACLSPQGMRHRQGTTTLTLLDV